MGAFEEIKGKAKEAVGEVTDNADLVREGEAQEDKGQAELRPTKARAKAKAHEAKAEVHEARQKSAERASSPKPEAARAVPSPPHGGPARGVGEVGLVEDAGDPAVAVVPAVLVGSDDQEVERRSA